MGFTDNDNTGIGNAEFKKSIEYTSGATAAHVDIYNYGKITLHFQTSGKKAGADYTTMTLTNDGCVYNGQPTWSWNDGVYDGDYDTSYISHTGHHHLRNHDDRFGGGECLGTSHRLRWGGGDGADGRWEFISHGRVSAWCTSNDLNFFGCQFSGGTKTGSTYPVQANALATGGKNGLGYWINVSADTTSAVGGENYGLLRSGTTTYTAGRAGLTGLTAFGTEMTF